MKSCARLSGAWVLALLGLIGCGTDAVGVEACRKIEFARCDAALPCGQFAQTGSVEECKRFSRDNCLHGLALPAEPADVAVSDCVEAIQLAGKCAADRRPDYSPSRCNANVFGSSSAKKICEIVKEPERTPQCSFLIAEPVKTPSLDETDAGDAGK